MKRQPVRPEILQDFLLIQSGTIWAHQHVIVRVQLFKHSVVLAVECAIEDFVVDPQDLICFHATSFRFCFAWPLLSLFCGSTLAVG